MEIKIKTKVKMTKTLWIVSKIQLSSHVVLCFIHSCEYVCSHYFWIIIIIVVVVYFFSYDFCWLSLILYWWLWLYRQIELVFNLDQYQFIYSQFTDLFRWSKKFFYLKLLYTKDFPILLNDKDKCSHWISRLASYSFKNLT